MNGSMFDVIVVGAGLSGIIAAQRYLDVHPHARLAILEKDADIGGVFSRRRNYDAFWTQWTVGLSEFSDMPMQRPPEDDCRHDFYRAKWTTHYLEQYVDRKNDEGRTLRGVIRFGMDVENIKKIGTSWEISCKDSEGSAQTFHASKLMVASGLNTAPNMPRFLGAEDFKGPIIHSIDFGAQEHTILHSSTIQNITIIGGGKSAADMLYEALQAGKTVSWIIRTTGAGAPFFAPGKGQVGYKNAFELGSTRIVASINPSTLHSRNWWTSFLHGTTIGAALLKRIIATMDKEIRGVADYQGRESDKGFEKLEYNTPFFWQGDVGGLLHHDDFFDLVAKNVHIYRDDVASLTDGVVRLTGGEELQSDAILCGTGWTPSIQFFDEEEKVRLGLPHDPEAGSSSTREKWEKLDAAADKTTTTTYPLLSDPPPFRPKITRTTPYRLYQGMLPLHDPTIIMMNHIVTSNKLLAAEVQAMWAVAHFDNKIKHPSVEEMEERIALWVAFSRRRYLSTGQEGNNIVFESIVYADALLKDMGLEKHRKGWWKDLVEPFWPADLGRAWKEYLDRVGATEVK